MSEIQEVLEKTEEVKEFTRRDKHLLSDIVMRGVDLQRKLLKVQEQLKEVKEQALPLMRSLAAGKQSSDFSVAGGSCEYKRSEQLSFGKSLDPAREVLGKDFEKYFREEITWKPDTRKLKDLICDGDDATGMALRKVTTLQESESVSFKTN